MELEHAFTVPVGIDDAWRVLLDVERVAPCMPGATLESVEGDHFSGRVKVKVGPMQVTYTGTASFVEVDEEEHRAVIDARGRETRGSGTANATVRARLIADGEATTQVRVNTDLAVTGKPAQFGRNVLADVGDKLIGRFADCLADQLAGSPDADTASADQPERTDAAALAPARSAAAAPGQPPQTQQTRPPATVPAATAPDNAIDLLEVAGAPVLKRLAAPALAVVLLMLLRRRLRR